MDSLTDLEMKKPFIERTENLLMELRTKDFKEALIKLTTTISDARENGRYLATKKMNFTNQIPENTPVVVLEKTVWDELVAKIKESEKLAKAPSFEWLTNDEMMQFLKISKRTAQHYRDSGMISFSQIGDKIYYKMSDIEEMLNKSTRKAFKTIKSNFTNQ